jgi:hypothetical protein
MSNLVFPDTLMGFDIKVTRKEIYSTIVQSAASGKELRAGLWSTPRYSYQLNLNFVRQSGFSVNTLVDELITLVTFFETHKGKWDSFLYNDPVDGVQRRVRFDMDELTLERLFNLVWSGGSIDLISVK